MKIDISHWNIKIQADLYVAGRTEDGSEYTADCYYVVAERKDGKRLAHHCQWDGAVKETSPDGFDFFADVRDKARDKARRLVSLIKNDGFINDDYWTTMSPSYGSEYYCKVNGL